MMAESRAENPEPRTRNQERRPPFSILHSQFSIPLILLLALLLRVLLWSQPLHQPANDEAEYITVARDLLAGRGWQFYEHYRWLRAPLYPLFLAGSLWLAGDDLHRAALPNLALSVVNIYLIYRLSLKLVGRKAAHLAALLAAVLLTSATFASLYMSETLFTCFFTAALVCLVRPPTADRRPLTTEDNDEDQAGTARSRAGLREWSWVIGGGILFGLATLTRSITLLFIPVVALWLLVRQMAHNTQPLRGYPTRIMHQVSRFNLSCCLIFVLCSLLTIAPWSARNALAYGRPILVETGLSFNLWFFNQPRESHEEIYRALESIPNPAERSDYATAKGLARLREDPTILLRNLWPNWKTLLSADTTEDRFLQESYSADVGLPLFAAALIFDDALCALIVLAAVAGLLSRRSRLRQAAFRFGAPEWLIGAWTLYVVLTVLLTHGETRYRHFLFPVLIPYAAWMLTPRQADTMASRQHDSQLALSGRLLAIVAQWGFLLGIGLGVYPWGWAGQNLARGWYTAAGDIAWDTGDIGAALRAYERAEQAQETPDVWLRRGDASRALGDLSGALHAYREANRLAPLYIAANARLGDLLRELGDEEGARAAFKGDYADPQRVVDWAWDNLRPAARAELDIGDGLDFGYVGGFYPAELIDDTTARWAGGHGMVRLGIAPRNDAEGSPSLDLVRLRLAAPRPGGSSVPAQVCAVDSCWNLNVAPDWRTYTLLFQTPVDEPLEIEINSDTFVAPDGRQLGVLVDSAQIQSIPKSRPEHTIAAEHR
jgi:Dolichyl-phosphate-mannose-protein mannosyltransferase